MNSPEYPWRKEYLRELSVAETARVSGNEGMARVCARRAAGIAVRAYFRQKSISHTGLSAYDHLHQLMNTPDTTSTVKALVERLLIKVNIDHTLPAEIDLIQDARDLAKELFPPSLD